MKRIFARSVALAVLASMTVPASASQLSSAMDGMFTATTIPQSFNTPSMTGVAFGSASVRFPTQNFNIIAFEPPRVNAGCSGIDLYMGSFSFINSEQLKAMMRSIAQGAVGYAFKAAIRSMCNMCASVIEDLEAKMQALNALGKNTCALAKMIGEPVGAAMAGKADEAEAMLRVSRQKVDDWMQGSNANQTEGRSDKANKYNGNLVWRALYNTGAAERIGGYGKNAYWGMSGDATDLIISLVGTYIVPASDPNATTCTAGDSGAKVCEKRPITLEGKIGFDQVFEGAATNGETVNAWKCDSRDTEMSCQNPTSSAFTFEGTKKYTYRMLFGQDASAYAPTSDSIMGVVMRLGPGGLSSTQRNFLSSAGSMPLMAIINRTQRHPAVAQAILARAAEQVAHEMAYKLISEAISAAEDAFSKNTVEMPAEMRAKIVALRAEISNKAYLNPTVVVQNLNNLETLLRNFERNLPRAYSAAGMKR